jgi:2,3-bisphosphoglycerate-independent phosphoglycerate mutase
VPVAFHAWTDGRDTPPQSGREDLARLQAALPDGARIATVSGRYFAMDRDNRWERVGQAYRAMADAEGPRCPSADAVMAAPMAGASRTSSWCRPSLAVIPACGTATASSASTSAPIACARSCPPSSNPTSRAFRGRGHSASAGRSGYAVLGRARPGHGHRLPAGEPQPHPGGGGVGAGRTQLRLAETEKYPHVTYS